MAGFHLSRTERNELLKDTLCWAIGADLIEGFPELDDDLFNQMIIPVYLADTGKRAALRAGGGRGVAWMAGLSEGGVQVKLIGRSRVAGQFDLLSVKFRRPQGSYDKFNTEAEDWNYGPAGPRKIGAAVAKRKVSWPLLYFVHAIARLTQPRLGISSPIHYYHMKDSP